VLLLLGADGEDDRTGELLADRIDALGHRERTDLLVGDQVLAQGAAVAAIGLRPGDAGKPGAIHRRFPGHLLLQAWL